MKFPNRTRMLPTGMTHTVASAASQNRVAVRRAAPHRRRGPPSGAGGGAPRAVFARPSPGAEIVPVAVASVVAPQPTSDDETIRGALHRAREARRVAGADCGG